MARMIRIDIRPLWRIGAGEEREFDFRLVELLAELDATAKLTQAAERAGISYRHAWNLIRDWERFFGAPLVVKSRGRGTQLSPLGRSLLLGGRRAQARLAPQLENLASEFARELNTSLCGPTAAIALHASHDFAIAGLRDMSSACGVHIDLQYKGSFDALAALRRGECDVAGFHVPEGPLGELMARRYSECLPLADHRLIALATRTQGLMVHPGNPKAVRAVADLCRPDVRMVNRQRGSGTRALLEFMISAGGLDRARMQGYDNEEITHAAVAALIAGRQADAGFGVQAAAAQYRLDFVPLCTERYYLACRAAEVESPAIAALVALLRGAAFRQRVAALPGYDARDAGAVRAGFGPAGSGARAPRSGLPSVA
jgi:putative molybdopterin biosynthesis protein